MNHPVWKKVIFAIIVTMLALGIRLAFLQDILGGRVPFLFFFISLAASGWYGGCVGGITATLLGGLAAAYYFPSPPDFIPFLNYYLSGLFILVGIFISCLFESFHKSRKGSAYLAAILESSDDAIVSKNLDGIIMSWNKGAQKVFGFTAAEAIGQSITIIIPDDRMEEERDILRRMRADERINHFETVRQGKDGHLIDISLTVSPVHDETGKIIGISKIARDITEQKRLREALREQQEWYRVTLGSIGDAVIATDIHARVTFLNPEAEKMTGWKMQEALEQPLTHVFNIVNEETRQRAENPVARVIERGKVIGLANHTLIIDKNGVERPIEDSAAPIYALDGRLLGVVLVFHDFSNHRALERELKNQAAMLMDRDRRKDEFLAMLAHELRNPLAPISNALHLLENPSTDKKIQKEAVGMANRQVSHMVRLLDDLLDVSRITHGKIVLQHRQIDLCEIIRTAIDTATPLIEARHHTLQAHVPQCPVMIIGDATRLAQLLGNLLNNAAKYTSDGGKIEFDAYEDGKEVVIRVRDNGIGIPKEKLPYIFDMFMQVDSSMERAQGGLGIGLMLVKNIAELHGGTVEAYSEGKGKGTEFTVRLPILERLPDTAPKETDKERPIPSSGSFRVLVVDDNVASAKTLGWMIEALGHQVELAYNAKGAIDIARAYKPDVVLLDIGLPDINGYEVCRIMRKDPALKHTVFIAQTGWGQEQHLQRSREAGFDSHLIKPINIEALQQQLEKIEEQAH